MNQIFSFWAGDNGRLFRRPIEGQMIKGSSQQFRRIGIAILMFSAVTLAGCVHRAPLSVHDQTAMISGHNTIHVSMADARQTVLTEAASITVDHGYRLFKVMTPIRPGSDVTIHVYGAGEIDPAAPNVYDAHAIAAGRMQPAEGSVATP